ncbi:MAG: hypothetical protein WCG05_04220 [Alphaproteobacteria bacterium]
MAKKITFKSMKNVDDWIMSDKRGTDEQFKPLQKNEEAPIINLRKLTIRIPDELYEEFKLSCVKKRINMTKFIEAMIIKSLDSE